MTQTTTRVFPAAPAMLLCWLGAASLCPAQTQGGPAENLSAFGQPASGAPAGPSNALDKEDLETYLRHLYAWAPEIQIEIGDFQPSSVDSLLRTNVLLSYKLRSQEKVFFITKDGRQVLDGSAYEIAKNPFQSNLQKITTSGHPSFGTPGAPVVIVAYSDFQCPYCAKEAKVLRTQLIENYPQQVRVYFRDYPLKTHNWALAAAVAGRCIHRLEPEIFWRYHDWIFERQNDITPRNLKGKVMEFAGGEGLDGLKLGRCIDSRETGKIIQESKEEGASVGVRSTPTLFINGRPLTGAIKWERLKQILDNEIAYQKVANNAGDDCGCEVELPTFGSP